MIIAISLMLLVYAAAIYKLSRLTRQEEVPLVFVAPGFTAHGFAARGEIKGGWIAFGSWALLLLLFSAIPSFALDYPSARILPYLAQLILTYFTISAIMLISPGESESDLHLSSASAEQVFTSNTSVSIQPTEALTPSRSSTPSVTSATPSESETQSEPSLNIIRRPSKAASKEAASDSTAADHLKKFDGLKPEASTEAENGGLQSSPISPDGVDSESNEVEGNQAEASQTASSIPSESSVSTKAESSKSSVGFLPFLKKRKQTPLPTPDAASNSTALNVPEAPTDVSLPASTSIEDAAKRIAATAAKRMVLPFSTEVYPQCLVGAEDEAALVPLFENPRLALALEPTPFPDGIRKLGSDFVAEAREKLPSIWIQPLHPDLSNRIWKQTERLEETSQVQAEKSIDAIKEAEAARQKLEHLNITLQDLQQANQVLNAKLLSMRNRSRSTTGQEFESMSLDQLNLEQEKLIYTLRKIDEERKKKK